MPEKIHGALTMQRNHKMLENAKTAEALVFPINFVCIVGITLVAK